MRFLKQSTAFTFRIGPFLDDTDGKTAEIGLSIGQADIQISKAGGAFAQTSASPTTTHDADGWYQCPLTATDTGTLGALTVQVAMSGALPVWEHFMVLPANIYDSLIGGSDYLQVDAIQIEGSDATDQVNAACDTAISDAALATAANLATVDGIVDAILVDTGTTLDGKIDVIDGIVDTIVARVLGTIAAGTHVAQTGDSYARIGATGSGLTSLAQSSVCTETRLSELDAATAGKMANQVDIIQTDTTTDIPATITTMQGNVTDILTDTATTIPGLIADLDTVVDRVEADTQDLQTQIGVDGAGLTALPWNAAWDAEVQSECTDALNAYDPPTKAELDTAVANVSVDEIQASALADLFNTDSGTAYASAVAGSVVKEIADNAGGSSLTAGDIADAVWDEALVDHDTAGTAGLALATASSGGVDPSVLADAVWDEAISGHTTAGTFGAKNQKVVPSETLNDYKATGFSTHSAADVKTAVEAAGSHLTLIKAKTDNLPADPADQSAVEAAISALNNISSADVNAACDTALSDYGANTTTPPTADEIALAILKKDWTGVTGEAARSLLNAVRFLRNKWSVSGGTLTVTKEDDTTAAWTASVTGDAAADPIIGSTPL